MLNTLGNSAAGGLLVSFIIPFLFMLFARVSMDRVWALYYMLQMMTNLSNYIKLLTPSNSYYILIMIKNVVCFRLMKNETVQRLATKYIFKTKWALVVKDLVMDQGADVTNQVIFFTVLTLVLIGQKFKYSRDYCTEQRQTMVWNGWLRGKITCYFPNCIFVFTNLVALFGD